MGNRNDIQLAIGYGFGAGMAVAGVLVVVGAFVLSRLGIGARPYVLGATIVLGGVAIAVINALKLDRETVSDIEDPSE
jgi:high-affinity Fe2+/Pb2+ permease